MANAARPTQHTIHCAHATQGDGQAQGPRAEGGKDPERRQTAYLDTPLMNVDPPFRVDPEILSSLVKPVPCTLITRCCGQYLLAIPSLLKFMRSKRCLARLKTSYWWRDAQVRRRHQVCGQTIARSASGLRCQRSFVQQSAVVPKMTLIRSLIQACDFRRYRDSFCKRDNLRICNPRSRTLSASCFPIGTSGHDAPAPSTKHDRGLSSSALNSRVKTINSASHDPFYPTGVAYMAAFICFVGSNNTCAMSMRLSWRLGRASSRRDWRRVSNAERPGLNPACPRAALQCPDLCRAGVPRACTWSLLTGAPGRRLSFFTESHLRALATPRSDLLIQPGLRNGFSGLL